MRGEHKALNLLKKLRDKEEFELWTGAMQRAEVVFLRLLLSLYPALTYTFRDLGPSNSQKKIFCQVPKTRRPFSTITVTELPIIDVLIWLSEFPSM